MSFKKTLPILNDKLLYRFRGKVNVNSKEKCWEWNSTSNPYGIFYINRVPYAAHRISYFLANNEDPKDLLVCHTCDNTKCVNPNHFFLGTTKDNAQDALKKGRIGDDRLRKHQIKYPESIAKGENNGISKVTEAEVLEMRNEYSTGTTSLNKLATKYGLTNNTVWHIIHKKTWKHI